LIFSKRKKEKIKKKKEKEKEKEKYPNSIIWASYKKKELKLVSALKDKEYKFEK